MSLYIETEKITGILLSDGWHEIVPGSCGHDAYEYIQDGRHLAQPKAETTGLGWAEVQTFTDINGKSEKQYIQTMAALDKIHAVRYAPAKTNPYRMR